MNLDLQGKTAIVCGASQGIGKAAAIELSLLGANVTLIARDEQKLKQTWSELHHGHQLHHYISADFSNPVDVKKKIDEFVSKHTVHILVNNTGGPPGVQAIDANPEDFLKAFSNHLICNQILTQAVVPGMKRDKYGRIINIISTSVKVPLRGLGVSNTIRVAVANWSKTLSLELGPFGITVNNVLPGATMTGRLESILNTNAQKKGITLEEAKQDMIKEIPLGRIAEPSEVAAAIAFLASPAASYINGINVPVDGGRTGSL